ncbi:rCG54390 [Rattus norvegicus]|uniref:RCG54390 n=1 Tax=Rattus norvegicus TaxID=10116 RepID=A6JAD6_RAT|nr:rCG54390 [Rattus norvegicus]
MEPLGRESHHDMIEVAGHSLSLVGTQRDEWSVPRRKRPAQALPSSLPSSEARLSQFVQYLRRSQN